MEPQKRLSRNHLVLSFLFTILFIVIISIFYGLQFFERPDLFLYDLHFKLRGAQSPSGKIILILMDQRSASSLKREKGTWSRLQMARAIENLSSAGAEVIGLDMVFFAPAHEKEEDMALAGAIERCGNVILAKFVAVEGRGDVTPLSMFQEGMIGDGFINMFPDQDGILRKTPFLSIKPVKEGIEPSPSFSLEVARAFLDLDFVLDFSHKDHFRLGAKGVPQLILPYPDLRIYFYGGEEVFTRLSYANVVHNRLSPGIVKGKIALIGSALATDKDFFATPFSGYGRRGRGYKGVFGKVLEEGFGPKTVGVACHANAIETILNGAFIRKWPEKYVMFMVVAFGFLGLIFYLQRPGALWGVFILLISFGVIMGLSHSVFVHRLLWIEIAPLLGILSVQYISGIASQRALSKKKTKLVTSLFGKYVSQGVVNDILKGQIGVRLEGRSREVTVLFSDLRGFTTLSESLTPQETSHLLNTYFDAMIPIVFEHQGTLDKLMGDAIMAFFGAPGELNNHPQKAAETALAMIRKLEELKAERSGKGIERLEVGLGLNTGQVTVGNLGSQSYMDYTVIGDMVNLGSRLEGLNKIYRTSILISEFTAERLDSRFVLRELDRVRVKGKGDAVTIFELYGFKDDLDQERIKLLRIFESGIRQYRNREWDQAEETFYGALRLFPQDGPSQLYLERIKDLLKDPPPPEWEPITVFTTK